MVDKVTNVDFNKEDRSSKDHITTAAAAVTQAKQSLTETGNAAQPIGLPDQQPIGLANQQLLNNLVFGDMDDDGWEKIKQEFEALLAGGQGDVAFAMAGMVVGQYSQHYNNTLAPLENAIQGGNDGQSLISNILNLISSKCSQWSWANGNPNNDSGIPGYNGNYNDPNFKSAVDVIKQIQGLLGLLKAVGETYGKELLGSSQADFLQTVSTLQSYFNPTSGPDSQMGNADYFKVLRIFSDKINIVKSDPTVTDPADLSQWTQTGFINAKDQAGQQLTAASTNAQNILKTDQGNISQVVKTAQSLMQTIIDLLKAINNNSKG